MPNINLLSPLPSILLGDANIWTAIQTFNDDIAQKFGTGGVVSLIYETADANANALLFVAPEGGATDVPAFIFGDASILNVDLTWFNGVVEPTIAVVNDAGDAYVSLDAGDDAVASAKGLYFKAQADEDIELINLSVTGTPRIYWDESEDQFRFSKGVVFDALCDVQGVWVATAAWTLPAFTLGGTQNANGQLISGVHQLQSVDGIYSVIRRDGASGWIFDVKGAGDASKQVVAFSGGTDTPVITWLAAATHTGLNITSGQSLKVAGTQVVAAQGLAVADASGGATVDTEARTAINTLLARSRAHGLIAT